jgi:iron complex transport system substrate-binding protein
LEQLNNEAYALGEMTGHHDDAQRYIRFNQKYQELVESRLVDLSEDEIPTVYGIYGSASQGFVVTPECTFGGQIISILHARNPNGDLNVSPAKVNPEWIFQKDPDIIINIGHWGSGDGYAIKGDSIGSARNDFINRTSYKTLKAVQTDRVYFCNMGLVNGPRSVIGLIYLAKAIYPNHFANIDPDAVRREYAQEFGFGDEPGVEWFYPPFEPVNTTAADVNATRK